MPEWLVWPGLVLLGAGVGVYGTIIGAGGGFVLVPLLLILYPNLPHESVTALSLGVVFFNAVSGSAAYARQRRIDFLPGGLFAAATVPGAAIGALLTARLASDAFQVAFAAVLLVAAVWLILPAPSRLRVTPPSRRQIRRMITDAQENTFAYSFDPWLGVGLGFGIGIVASLFGVGGGIFFVPAMVLLMRFPSHIATATSTFVLVFTGGTGALMHVIQGNYAGLELEELCLAVGVLAGAQLGAILSRALAHRQAIVARLFSFALILVAVRMIVASLL
jgi:uncharacterized protein